jgi:hypothetical protein
MSPGPAPTMMTLKSMETILSKNERLRRTPQGNSEAKRLLQQRA